MNIAAHVSVALLAAAASGGWELGPGAQVTFGGADKPLYKLDCTGQELVVTQFGVTKLMDLQRNEPVGDSEGTTLPEGAALMALATDKGEPDLARATAVRNPVTGWDMTIRLPKNDPACCACPRRNMSRFSRPATPRRWR